MLQNKAIPKGCVYYSKKGFIAFWYTPVLASKQGKNGLFWSFLFRLPRLGFKKDLTQRIFSRAQF
jgi:hypothetical protein